MLPNSWGFAPADEMDTNGNTTPTTLVGHHRNKLDLIRDSLRPFEQPTQDKLLLNSALSNQVVIESGHSAPCPVTEDNQRIMINALTQVGYDMESAYYALKLVNFKSVTDAVKVLSGLKFYNTNEPTHLKYALGMQASAPPQQNYTTEPMNSRFVRISSVPNNYSNDPMFVYGQSIGSSQSNFVGPETNEQLNRHRMDNYQRNYFTSPRQLDYNQASESSYPSGQNTSTSRAPVKQSTSFNPTFEQKTKIVKSSSVLDSPIRSSAFPASNKKTALSKTNNDNVPIIRSKLDRAFVPSQFRRPESDFQASRPKNCPSSANKTRMTPVQSIIIDPDNNANISRFAMTTSEPKSATSIVVNELSRRTTNLQVQAVAPSNLSVEPGCSPRLETPSAVPTKSSRCVSPISDSVIQRLRANEYESSIKPCKPAMYRFFMEQHTEKIIQQYTERNQRALQLNKEMEAAELPEKMKEKMFRYLCQKESRYNRLKRQKLNKDMFEVVKHIGVGAFGKVSLVRKKDTREVYAMKTLSKEDIIQKQQAAHVKAERDILAEANSEWVVKLYYSFQDSQNLYFVLDFIPGGDLMQLLINKGIFSESLSRMYTAELTCAIEYVHELGFIHRDIKPDNILIDKTGHIKLTDFGLCTGLRWTHDKRHYISYNDPSQSHAHYREDSLNVPINGKDNIKLLQYRQHKKRNLAHSIVGTGNYMAPEVIDRSGHTQACDWWSVGTILYEMTFGRPPFLSQTDDPLDTQNKILNWRKYLDVNNPIGARLSRDCIDVITCLCCDEKDRLGRNGAKEIKVHPWFKGIDFANLRKTPAEFVPKVEHAEDTSNFDTFEVNAEELFRENYSGPKAYNPAFFDFTFRHFFANDGGQKLNTTRSQQRPSLAPFIEKQPSFNSGSSSSAHQTTKSVKTRSAPKPTETNQPTSSIPHSPLKPPSQNVDSSKLLVHSAKSLKSQATEQSTKSQPVTTHSMFNRQLQKHNIANTNSEGLPIVLHSTTYANGAGLPPLAYNVRSYDKHGDSNI